MIRGAAGRYPGRHTEGFSRLGVFGDTWHSPKEGPKGLSGRLLGHVSYSERAPKGSSGLVGSKGFPEGGVFRRGFHRWIRDQRLGFLCEIGPRRVEIGPAEVLGAMWAVGFKIYGSGWSASSDRPNGRSVPNRRIRLERLLFDRGGGEFLLQRLGDGGLRVRRW